MTTRIHFVTGLLLLGFLVASAAEADAQGLDSEDLVKQRKVQFFYPLGTLIRSSKSPTRDMFVVGVLGRDPFDGFTADSPVNHLDEMVAVSNAQQEKRKRIVVKRFASARDVTPCDLLFISSENAPDSVERTAEARLVAAKRLVEKSKDTRPMLLVSDTPGFAEKGVSVNFYEVDIGTKVLVLLEFNPTAAKAAGFDTIEPGLYALFKRGFGRIVR